MVTKTAVSTLRTFCEDQQPETANFKDMSKRDLGIDLLVSFFLLIRAQFDVNLENNLTIFRELQWGKFALVKCKLMMIPACCRN